MFKKWIDRLMQPKPDGSPSSLYLYSRLYEYIKPYFFRALISTLITIPIGALDAAIAFSLKPYLDGMQVKHSVANVSYVPFIIVGFTLLQGLLNYSSIYLNGWLGLRVMNDIQRDLFRKLQSMDVQYFDTTTSGAVIQQYFRDPESLQANVLNNMKLMLTRLVSSISLIGVLIANSWKLSIIAIVVLPLILFPSTRIRKIIKSLVRETTNATSDVLSFYNETVGGIKVIYGYNLPIARLKKFHEFQKFVFTQSMRSIRAQGWLTPSMHIIASVGIALIIWQGSQLVVQGQLTTGAFVSFIAAMLMLYNPIKNLGSSLMTAQMSLLAAGRVFGLLNSQPGIVNKPGAVALEGVQQGIQFENVSFAYIEGRPVLHHLNLTFKTGETVAIVGNSGGGKTTIANLLPRFYEVTEGTIRIDGVDIRDYTLESLRHNIALVMQDNFLFNGTIRENILAGNPAINEIELMDAVHKAYLTDFINSLADGLNTKIGERGIMLSGGQRQRVAIARAMVKNAPIVILDEATSALDNQSEAIVQKALESLMVGRTVLVIAHRLSTIRNADRILVMDQGRVVEQGHHTELLAANGVYTTLYNAQFKSMEEMPDISSANLEALPV